MGEHSISKWLKKNCKHTHARNSFFSIAIPILISVLILLKSKALTYIIRRYACKVNHPVVLGCWIYIKWFTYIEWCVRCFCCCCCCLRWYCCSFCLRFQLNRVFSVTSKQFKVHFIIAFVIDWVNNRNIHVRSMSNEFYIHIFFIHLFIHSFFYHEVYLIISFQYLHLSQ